MVGALKNVAKICGGPDPSTRIAHDEIHVSLQRLQTRWRALDSRHGRQHLQHARQHGNATPCVLSNHVEHGVDEPVIVHRGHQ